MSHYHDSDDQCPHCLDAHARNARRAGETALIAAALRAGAAVTHGALALKLSDQVKGDQR